LKTQPTKLLVVDDEPVLIATLSILLRLDGYNVETAKNGLEALTKFHSFRPDLLITDFIMPEMDGWSLINGLRKSNPTFPIIVMSGVVPPFCYSFQNQEGAFCHVLKPVDVKTLKRLIDAMLIPLPVAYAMSH